MSIVKPHVIYCPYFVLKYLAGFKAAGEYITSKKTDFMRFFIRKPRHPAGT